MAHFCSHMKIEEPKTPYHGYSDSEDDGEGQTTRAPRRVSLVGAVDPVKLAESIEAGSSEPPAYKTELVDDDETDLTPEQIGNACCVNNSEISSQSRLMEFCKSSMDEEMRT